MSNLKLVMQREFIARVRNKTFVIMTFLSPLIFVGMISLIVWLTTMNNEEVHKVAFIDQSDLFASEFKDGETLEYINYSQYTLERAKDSVKKNKYEGLLFIPKTISQLEKNIEFYTEDSPNLGIIEAIEDIVSKRLTKLNYEKEGLDVATIKAAKAKVALQIENFSGKKTSKLSNYIKMFFGGVAGYLLMMFIIIYGNMVMRSVIEEKANRIIEIIISSVKPMQLMMGKILGTSLAGIVQFIIWVILGGILMTVLTTMIDIDPQQIAASQEAMQEIETDNMDQIRLILSDIWALPLTSLIISFLVYFIGGYFLYSAIYAAIGAAVDSETDSQQFMLPIILPLMLGIYVGFFSVIENPHGTVATVFSMIPLTSPIVMLMRIPFGVPWWEIAISILILLGTIFGIIWFAAKIYRIGILMYGKKPTYKELFKWLKY
ncbi:ABC transporter permease [Aquimarina rhabdastrellae]